MSLATSCPQCQAKYNVGDNLAGKTIRCKNCEHAFVVEADLEEETPSRKRKTQAVRDRSGPDSKVSAARRRPAEEDDVDDRPSRSRPADDDGPSRIKKKKSKAPLIVGLCLGGGLLLGGGVVLLLILLTPKEVESKLSDLKSDSAETRGQAIDWFLTADVNIPERGKVAGTFESIIADGASPVDLDLGLEAYLRWADKDNVPKMMEIVENPTLPRWSVNKTKRLLEGLGKIQDDRAADLLARKLADPSLSEAAMSGLKAMGAKAEKAVITAGFHPTSPDVRKRARELLQIYGTKDEAVAAEALRRMQSNQPELQRSTLLWFGENGTTDAKRRAEVSKYLMKLLDDVSADRTAVLKALKLWATKDALPQLVELAKREEQSPNELLIEVLAQFKDETAANAIALQFRHHFLREKVKQALLAMGDPAKKAVLSYINHPDLFLRGDARKMCSSLEVSASEYMDQTIADIGSDEIERRKAALAYLAEFTVGKSVPKKVTDTLNGALADKDAGVRGEALKALKVWCCKANTDTLVKFLKDERTNSRAFGHKELVMDILALIKDPEAVPEIAKGLANFFERGHVIKTLKAMGAAAEQGVIPYVTARDGGIRGAAVDILAEIGTGKSQNPLLAAAQVYNRDLGFVNAVKTALVKIQGRMSKGDN
jgi:predicted Zn finger-like uncharacterized protein